MKLPRWLRPASRPPSAAPPERREGAHPAGSAAAVWRSRPVFITSTFRDMHAERDHLRQRVFPELAERLRARFHHLEPIDLRLGIEGAEQSDEAAREIQVLKVCLGEIERSRPFLVGLLGDRYGWQPPAERASAAAREAGLDGDVAGRSVTELEILFGVLASSNQAHRSRFYFREPLPYDEMDPATAAEYSDERSADPTRQAGVEKLRALKRRIESALPDRVRRYGVRWDARRRAVTGLDEWGRQVVEDLWSDLEAEIAALRVAQPTTWQEQDRWALEEFVEARTRGFVGREGITRDLLAHALSPVREDAAWGVCLIGPPGGGKSSLFGRVYRELAAREDILVLAHAAGIGPQSTLVDRMLRRWVSELAAALGIAEGIEDNAPWEAVERRFHQLLGQASTGRRVVVLVDALNQFEAAPRAVHATWLPTLWPGNARLIVTAVPGASSEALAVRPGIRTVELAPLTATEAAEIARQVCQRYRNPVRPKVIEALCAKRGPEGAPAAGNALWLELAAEELNLLDAEDFARAERDFTGPVEQRLCDLALWLVERMPAEVGPLYSWMLERAEELFGKAWADAFVELIAVGRSGWRESDLRVLMPQMTGEPWVDLRFAQLRRAFRGHVVQRGTEAQWDFAHAELREVTLRRLAADPREAVAVHRRIASHLLALPKDDPLHETETMVHLIGADDREGAARYYAGELTAGELGGATAALTVEMADSTAKASPAGRRGSEWVCSLPGLGILDDNIRAELCRRFTLNLDNAMQPRGLLPKRILLLHAAQAAVAVLCSRAAANAGWHCDLSVSDIHIGDVLLAQGDVQGAIEAYRAALAIAERLARQDGTWQHLFSISHERIGNVALTQGDALGALQAFRAALVIAEQLTRQDPTSAPWQRELAVSHQRIGDVLLAQGDVPGAFHAYQATLAIVERLACQDPSNADWQRDLSISHERIGDVLLAQGNVPGALQKYQADLTIRERLARQDPTNADWQRYFSISHGKIGDVLRAQGDVPGALAAYRAALAITERLARQDPTNTNWQRDLAVSHIKIGDVLLAQGDVQGAIEAYRAALAIAERLARQDPITAGWQRELAVSHQRIGDVLLAQGDVPGAFHAYQATLAIVERLARQDATSARLQRDLAVSLYKLADTHESLGQSSEAARFRRACRDTLRTMKAKSMHLDPAAQQVLSQLERTPLD